MDHNVLKSIIFDQHEIIRNARIVPRRYVFDPHANYVVTGLRRAGKSTMLYKMVLDLVASGVDWARIIYVNFEDERLAEFGIDDFNDIVLVQSELSQERGFFFFDEIQNIAGWERFARRLADAGEHVCITGSNAKMLSRHMASTLGGRYLTKHISPYRFDEYLDAAGQPRDASALYSTRGSGAIAARFDRFCLVGGFPESLRYAAPREYVESVYQKVLLGDIVARNDVRNPQLLRVLVKKVAETVGQEVSFSKLHGMLKSIGFSTSKDTVIDYMALARDAYLVFSIGNVAAKFAEREGNPKYYFSDNGLLSLFLDKDDSSLLENEVAVAMRDVFGNGLHYLRSRKTGIDVDFYVPEAGLAVQVARSMSASARVREVGNLVKLAKVDKDAERLLIVTQNESGIIDEEGVAIEVKPAWRFILQDLIG